MRRAVLASERLLGGIDQLPCEVLADHVPSIVTELRPDVCAKRRRNLVPSDTDARWRWQPGVKVLEIR
jgi:hypothetical protein